MNYFCYNCELPFNPKEDCRKLELSNLIRSQCPNPKCSNRTNYYYNYYNYEVKEILLKYEIWIRLDNIDATFNYSCHNNELYISFSNFMNSRIIKNVSQETLSKQYLINLLKTFIL